MLLLCAATGPELAHLAPHFTPPGFPGGEGRAAMAGGWPEMTLWPLRLRQGDALCCVTGVGPVNAALALGLALARASGEGGPVSGVCCAGLAGAFDLQAFPLRRLCLVREEIWPEFGMHDGQAVSADAFGFPLWRPQGAPAVRDRLPLPDASALTPLGVRAPAPDVADCRSLTVAGVSAGPGRAADLHARYGADLENMEGFAVAYACARWGVPCMEVRAVSNRAGTRLAVEKDFPGALRALGRALPALGLL